MEEKELEELKKKLDKSNPSFTLLNDLFALFKGKLSGLLLILGLSFSTYQFFSMCETVTDPLENKTKILYLKYVDGKSFQK